MIQTPEHNILCLGGSVSVDRVYRQAQYKSDVEELMKRRHYSLETASKKAKLYWWKDEAFVYNTEIVNEITKAGINIDVVASHSAPDFCQPLSNSSVVYWSKMDEELETDINNERQDFTSVYNLFKSKGHKISHWFYGHYHQHNFEIIKGTRFTGLDMGKQSKQGMRPGGIFDIGEIH